MEKPEVFCTTEALDEFFTVFGNSMADISVELSVKEKYLLWNKLFFSDANLILDVNENDFISLASSNPYYKRMLKTSQTGGSKLDHWPEWFKEIEDNNRFCEYPNALFFDNKSDDDCSKLQDKRGVFFMNTDLLLENTSQVFQFHLFNVSKSKDSTFNSWDDFQLVKHPMHSMIIIDNYILKDKSDLEDNIIPMLNSLLPDGDLEEGFNLIIATVGHDNNYLKRFEELQVLIRKLITRRYSINLGIAFIPVGANHDRYIFSNYYWVNSGDSFNYLRKGRVKKNTTVTITSIFTQGPTVYTQYRSLLQRIKDVTIKHADCVGNCDSNLW